MLSQLQKKVQRLPWLRKAFTKLVENYASSNEVFSQATWPDQKDKKLENMDQTFRQEFANINA